MRPALLASSGSAAAPLLLLLPLARAGSPAPGARGRLRRSLPSQTAEFSCEEMATAQSSVPSEAGRTEMAE